MSYGVDHIEMQSRIADFVGKILGGAKPTDIPVEQPTELAVNLTTAKAIGVEIPLSLQLRADKVIE